MNKPDIKSFFTPFPGSLAHKVSAVAATLLVAVGLIFCAHLLLHGEKSADDTTNPSSSLVEQPKTESEAAK